MQNFETFAPLDVHRHNLRGVEKNVVIELASNTLESRLRLYREYDSLLSPDQLAPQLFCVLTVLYCIFVLMGLMKKPLDLDLDCKLGLSPDFAIFPTIDQTGRARP